MTKIERSAFTECSKLKQINIPNGVISLYGVFPGCNHLEKIIIPDDHPNLLSIDGVIFNKEPMVLVFYPPTKKEKSYVVPEGTTKILSFAFEKSKLESLEIPGSVKKLESNAFIFSKLKSVILHEGVEEFGSWPFEWCESLTEITLPSTLITFKGNPFLGCKKLKTVIVAEDNPSLAIIDGALVDQKNKTLLWYPIPSKAKSWTVPEGIEKIASDAFHLAKLNELILSEGVKSITQIDDLKNLKRMVLPSTLESIDIHQSYGINLSKIVFVVTPGSYAENYCQAYNLNYEVAGE